MPAIVERSCPRRGGGGSKHVIVRSCTSAAGVADAAPIVKTGSQASGDWMAACAAASRATGTRKGLQLT
jgi:hypothetical protein